MLTDHIGKFFGLVANEEIDIYNEVSLQLELGAYLRLKVPSHVKVQFERPVAFFELKQLPYVKKEIDIAIFSRENKSKIAVELKFPRNGQYPEQMFKACQDIAFLEQLVEGGFDGGAFVIVADDPLFFCGNPGVGLYRCFRGGNALHGVIQKPTGAKDQIVTISGTHKITWANCGVVMKFAVVSLGDNGAIL